MIPSAASASAKARSKAIIAASSDSTENSRAVSSSPRIADSSG